jgi:hypothetical protein
MGGLALIAAITSGCELFVSSPPPEPVSNWSTLEARAFHEYPLHWLGQSYQGLDLTSMRTYRDGDGVRHAEFFYGKPSLVGDSGGSWIPPLEVNIQPYCGFSPGEFLSYDEYYEIRAVQIRGVDGYLQRYSSREASLHLWAGASTIVLDTRRTELDIEQAARDLIPISENAGATGGRLPRPISTDC